MSSVLRNDKVVLIKEYENFKVVGKVFEVANITDTSIVLRDVNTKIAIGSISIDDFDMYFKKGTDKRSWTPWTHIKDGKGDLIAFYRTNYKKVQVRTLDGYRSESSCNKKEDEFNLFFGINLAYMRCKQKRLNNCEAKCVKELNSIRDDIKLNNDAIDALMKNTYKSINK